MSSMPTLRWLGHVVRMDDGALAKEIFECDVKDNRRKGRPKLKWRRTLSNLVLKIGEGA